MPILAPGRLRGLDVILNLQLRLGLPLGLLFNEKIKR